MFYAHHIGTFLTTYSKKQIAGDDRVKRLLNPRDVACNYNLSKTCVCAKCQKWGRWFTARPKELHQNTACQRQKSDNEKATFVYTSAGITYCKPIANLKQ